VHAFICANADAARLVPHLQFEDGSCKLTLAMTVGILWEVAREKKMLEGHLPRVVYITMYTSVHEDYKDLVAEVPPFLGMLLLRLLHSSRA